MRNDFIAHSAKGTSWKNVKYLKKIPLGNNRFYYIYTQKELDAYNKRNSGAVNVLSDKEKERRKQQAAKAVTLEDLAKNGFAISGKTTSEKTANLNKAISKGQSEINKAISKEESKSKSGGSGSSGSSKKSKSGGAAKGGGSGSSKKSGSEKEGSKSSASKSAKSQETKQTQTKKADNTPINLDTLKKVYGAKDEDVTTHKLTSSEFKNEMLSKYKDGAMGYLMAGDKAYKWVISGGNIVLRDYNTDKEVSFDDYLKDVKEFKEFQTNKKKK